MCCVGCVVYMLGKPDAAAAYVSTPSSATTAGTEAHDGGEGDDDATSAEDESAPALGKKRNGTPPLI
jgi:hypothetical protein